jgi:putative ABC transport system permease protein
MKTDQEPQPPQRAQKFLKWYCRPELLEDLQGDLYEYFQRNCKNKGLKLARWIYVIDVIKFARLYTLRKPKPIHFLINWIMIGSYFKISMRSIMRNKLFSAINIAGLSIGLSVGLLVISLIHDLFSYDRFHEKGDRIYRVNTTLRHAEGNTDKFASTSVKLARAVGQQLPGVEDAAILRRGLSGDVTLGNLTLPMNMLWANGSFFNVFTFPLQQGNPETALSEPNSIVLTEKAAKKIFGHVDAINQMLRVDSTEYKVTGVMKDIPFFSHLQFEALTSFATLDRNPVLNRDFNNWESISDTYVYLLLPKGANLGQLQTNLDKLSKTESALLNKKISVTADLQPLRNIFLGQDLHNEIGHSIPEAVLWVVIGLALVAILSACFNYTNLSMARSLGRSKEVGVRKVVGAFSGQVVMQFVVEAVVLSLLALVISSGLFFLLRSAFLSTGPGFAELNLTPSVVVSFFILAIVVGIIAGVVPAVSIARINPVQVLKSMPVHKIFRHVSLRQVLIFLQYSFSLCFVASALIIYTQYKYFITRDLGYNTDGIVNIDLQGNSAELVKKTIGGLAYVQNLSGSQLVTGLGSNYGAYVKFDDPQDSTAAGMNGIDEKYIPMHQYRLIAGRNLLAAPDNGATDEILVNEQMMKRFNLGNNKPEKALGALMTTGGKQYHIVGVLKDFHYGSLYKKIEPVFFRYSPGDIRYLNIKVSKDQWPAIQAKLRTVWKKIDKVHPLAAGVYHDEILQFYHPLTVMSKIVGSLAFFTIFIASMGLFGMVVFTVETRIKEVSVRKVLGASEASLIYLLSKGFVSLLVGAAVLALPLTYWLFDKIVLSNVAYHAPVSLADFVICLAIFLAVSLLIICSRTFGVARTNPAHVLKSE